MRGYAHIIKIEKEKTMKKITLKLGLVVLCGSFFVNAADVNTANASAKTFDKKALKAEIKRIIDTEWAVVEDVHKDLDLELKLKQLNNLLGISLQFSSTIETLKSQYITIKQELAAKDNKSAPSYEKLSNRFILKIQRICGEIITEIIQKSYPQKSWWEGFSPVEAVTVPFFCLMIGREIQNKTKVPELKELFSLKTVADCGIGYGAATFMTIWHEFGHAALYRLNYGAWPKVSIGSNFFTDKEKFSLFNGKWSLRGYNPFVGATLCTDAKARKWRDLPILLAGGLAGTIGYYGLKTAVCNLKGDTYPDFAAYKKYINEIKPNDMAQSSLTSGFLKLVDFAVYIQLANALLTANGDGGTDAKKALELIGYRIEKKSLY